MILRVLALLLLLLALVACMREGSPPVVPLEIAVTELPDGGKGASFASSASPASQHECKVHLRASPLTTASGCTIDEQISKGDGVLTYPCSGDGKAAATFGEHHFEGEIRQGVLKLALTLDVDWQDGCQWETHQAIRGAWKEGRPDALTWTYIEEVKQGTGCYGACKAQAEIEAHIPSP